MFGTSEQRANPRSQLRFCALVLGAFGASILASLATPVHAQQRPTAEVRAVARDFERAVGEDRISKVGVANVQQAHVIIQGRGHVQIDEEQAVDEGGAHKARVVRRRNLDLLRGIEEDLVEHQARKRDGATGSVQHDRAAQSRDSRARVVVAVRPFGD